MNVSVTNLCRCVSLPCQGEALSSGPAEAAGEWQSARHRQTDGQRPPAHRPQRHLQEIPWTQQCGLHGETHTLCAYCVCVGAHSVCVGAHNMCVSPCRPHTHTIYMLTHTSSSSSLSSSPTRTYLQTRAAPPLTTRCLTTPLPRPPTCPPSRPSKRRGSRCTPCWTMPSPWCRRPPRAASVLGSRRSAPPCRAPLPPHRHTHHASGAPTPQPPHTAPSLR